MTSKNFEAKKDKDKDKDKDGYTLEILYSASLPLGNCKVHVTDNALFEEWIKHADDIEKIFGKDVSVVPYQQVNTYQSGEAMRINKEGLLLPPNKGCVLLAAANLAVTSVSQPRAGFHFADF